METVESILGQFFVAFGQGTGPMIVDRKAIMAFRNRYEPVITAQMLANWGTIGVQVLERVRAIGRMAAHKASVGARVSISNEDLFEGMVAVEMASQTSFCPPMAVR